MKAFIKVIYFFIILLSFQISYSQVPYGQIKIGDNLSVDDTEITVGRWLMFYYYSLKSQEPTPNKEMLPVFDSLAEVTYKFLFFSMENDFKLVDIKHNMGSTQFKLPVPTDSLNHRAFKKSISKYYNQYLALPITNITYEQAVEYCKWRTIVENEIRYRRSWTEIKEWDLPVFVYKLPSVEQFMLYNTPIDSLGKIKKKITSIKNYSNAGNELVSNTGTQKVKVASYYSNNLGLYDVQGNVSEMTEIKGIAIGGSYFHDYESTLNGTTQHYNGPQSWLGLRCIAISDKTWEEWDQRSTIRKRK